jgi:GAF domain-containing protein/HAMP domain-containing protein
MIDQKTINPPDIRRLPITPQRIALIRVWNDLLLVILAFIFLNPILNNPAARIIIGSAAGMFIGSMLGYFLIREGRQLIGMGFVIYGFLFGLTTISIFVDGLGPFALVTMVLVTTLSVSYAIPVRRAIEAISASLVLGIFSLVFDLYWRSSELGSLVAPPQLITSLWFVTLILVGIIFYFIIQQFPYFSLRTKMITAFAVTTILALAVLGFLNSRSVQRVLTVEAKDSLLNAASQTEETLRQYITTNFQSIKTEANLPVMIDFLSASENERQELVPQIQDTLSALADKNPDYIYSYAVLDLQGNVLADTQTSHIDSNEADLSIFKDVVNRSETILSPVEIDPFSSEPSLYFGTPVFQNTTPIGVLRVRYNADILQNIIAKSNGLGGTDSFAVLFDEYFIHLAHGTEPSTIFTSVAPLETSVFEGLIAERRIPDQDPDATFLDLFDLEANLITAQSSNNASTFFEATDIATGDLLNQVVVLNMQQPSWLLAFFQPKEVYLGPIESLANNTILLGLMSGFGAVVLGIVLTQILTRPILNLTETAQQVSKGNFEAKVEISTEDEIGALGKTFNTMTVQLQNLIANLESQVETRTKSLRNQTAQLRASAEVARDIASEQKLQNLLDRASDLIKDRFGYYHVGIYLIDPKGEYANLVASTDQPGIRLIQAEHRYKIEGESNVGYACMIGEALIASISEDTAPLIFHPLLPNSQSELILPLKLGTQTLGVIDIHSTNPTSFSQEDVQIFQTLADQIAISIQKARYQEEIQETLHELETAYGTFTRETWQNFVQPRKNVSGYRYNRNKVETVKIPTPEVIEAWNAGERIVAHKKSSGNSDPGTSTLAIPMKVRGEVIGVLNVEFESDQIPTDTTDLVTEIADRLGLILENARLIETAQKQVEREQLTSHITNTIRQSLDMDMVLQTAVQEIGKNLGLAEVELRLGNLNRMPKNDQDQSNGTPSTDLTRD